MKKSLLTLMVFFCAFSASSSFAGNESKPNAMLQAWVCRKISTEVKSNYLRLDAPIASIQYEPFDKNNDLLTSDQKSELSQKLRVVSTPLISLYIISTNPVLHQDLNEFTYGSDKKIEPCQCETIAIRLSNGDLYLSESLTLMPENDANNVYRDLYSKAPTLSISDAETQCEQYKSAVKK